MRSVNMVDAPRLLRLIMMNTPLRSEGRCRIRICKTPSLQLFGYFDPVMHFFQVGNNSIKAGTLVNARAMVPSVKILALEFHFRVRNDAKMLPSFLRCFPNVEKLYIHSEKINEPTGKLNFKFWQEAGAPSSVSSQLVFHDFRGENGALAFLKFFVESANVLERLMIVCANGCFSSVDEANAKVKKTLFAGTMYALVAPELLTRCASAMEKPWTKFNSWLRNPVKERPLIHGCTSRCSYFTIVCKLPLRCLRGRKMDCRDKL